MKNKEKILNSKEIGLIFFTIVSGIDYTTAIAKKLNKTPATVNEQIRKLEKINLIERGERDQRQKYRVNWEEFFNCFIERIKNNELEFLEIAKTVSIFRKDPKYIKNIEKGVEKRISIWEKIKENKTASLFVKNYFEILSKRFIGANLINSSISYQIISVSQVIPFQTSIILSLKEKTKNKDIKQLLDLFYELREFIPPEIEAVEYSFNKSIEKLIREFG
jgi:DNA-binding Lrp family transcriptional regulator